LAVCDFADNLEFGLQKVPSQICETRMIIGQKDSKPSQFDRPTNARLETGNYEKSAHDSS
jgi:hypothetical protein